jgi:magnesium transporter
MIRGVKYSKGKTSSIPINKVNLLRDTVWIDITTKDKKELKGLEKKFKLYSRDLEDSIDMHEIPRLASRKDYTFIVLRSLTDKGSSVPLGIFLSKRFIITVHPKEIKPLKKFFNVVLTKEGKEFFSRGQDFLFFKIASEINRNLNGDLEKFDDKLDKLEDRVLNNKMEDSKDLLPLKKHLGYYKKALSSNRVIIEKLQNKASRFISNQNYLDLNNLHVEFMQAESMVEFQREKLTVVSEMHMTAISNRLNDIMRSFTVLASILLLPMLISGIWGMNFANIPFYNSPYGFYVPLVIMIASIILLFVFFKHKKWV